MIEELACLLQVLNEGVAPCNHLNDVLFCVHYSTVVYVSSHFRLDACHRLFKHVFSKNLSPYSFLFKVSNPITYSFVLTVESTKEIESLLLSIKLTVPFPVMYSFPFLCAEDNWVLLFIVDASFLSFMDAWTRLL
jgi:hypothetical protein